MSEKYKVVLVGLGNIGYRYDKDSDGYVFTHAKSVTLDSQYELSAGVDESVKSCEEFSCYYPDALVSTSLEDILIDVVPDVVIIATPAATHKEVLYKVLKFVTPKVVLCEKPLAPTIADAEDMVNLCNSFNVHLVVNYIRRSDPAVDVIKRHIDDGVIKLPSKGFCYYSKGLFNNGSHFINLLEFLFGSSVNVLKINSSDLADPEPDFVLSFKEADFVFLSGWESSYSIYEMEFITESGRVCFVKAGEQVEWYKPIKDSKFPGYTVLSEDPIIIESELDIYQKNVLSNVTKLLQGSDKYQLCLGAEALDTIKTLNRIVSVCGV